MNLIDSLHEGIYDVNTSVKCKRSWLSWGSSALVLAYARAECLFIKGHLSSGQSLTVRADECVVYKEPSDCETQPLLVVIDYPNWFDNASEEVNWMYMWAHQSAAGHVL